MSIAPVIDSRYRLHATDLGRGDHLLVICNVSWQGLENLQPMLHFDAFPSKRLPLTSEQCRALAEITHSPQVNDWIGHTICLRIKESGAQAAIQITAPPTVHVQRAIVSTPRRAYDGMNTIILLSLLLLLLLLVYLLDNSEIVWQYLGKGS